MTIQEFGNKAARSVLVQPVDMLDLSETENEYSVIRDMSGADFKLAAFGVQDWNHDLSPWKAPAVFGKEDFGDGAKETLREILNYCSDSSKTYYLGGYSLAGLFSLWAAYETDVFRGVAAASPSMWFPGFYSFMEERDIRTGKVYLSLGNKEEKARNPVMATVGDRIRAAESLLTKRGVDCILEWNEGNHFRDPDIRMAKGFAWVLGRE